MLNQLLIMRHGKSSWADGGLTDFERPLNKRGLRVVPQVAEFIHLQGLTPDLIVSSSAVRAKMTAEIFVENCKDVTEQQLQITEELYLAPASVYIEFLCQFLDSDVGTLMFVGHNPGMEELVEELSGDWEIMPTAGVAHFAINSDDCGGTGLPFSATVKNFWRPKEIHIL